MLYYIRVLNGAVVDRIEAENPLPPEWFPKDESWVQHADASIGWEWDGKELVPPARPEPEPERRLVPKSVIVDRLHAAGKLAAARAAIDANLYTRERWYVPDKPAVYADDPETLALLKAIGADPAVILA